MLRRSSSLLTAGFCGVGSGCASSVCASAVAQPGSFINCSNSSTGLLVSLQQDHDLRPSWKTGAPGWYVQGPWETPVASNSVPHPLRLHSTMVVCRMSRVEEMGQNFFRVLRLPSLHIRPAAVSLDARHAVRRGRAADEASTVAAALASRVAAHVRQRRC